jgi:Flp pilus assembly protein TadG
VRVPPASARGGERGAAGVTFVVAAGLALVVFVVLANLVVTQHTRAAVRAAVDEAARVGSRSDAPVADCEARGAAVLAGLLGPSARAGVRVSCAVEGAPSVVRAHADVTVVPWAPGLPAWQYRVDSAVVREVLP